MQISVLCLPPLGANCFLVADGKNVGIIDPAGDANTIIEATEGLTPSGIFLTHGHFDHVGAAAALRTHFSVPIYIHENDAAMVQSAEESLAVQFGFPYEGFTPDILFKDGDTLPIGGTPFTVLHTPGHTKGSACFLHEDVLFSGDTLFRGSIGIFSRENKNTMKDSVRRLLALPEGTHVLPGHEGETTILRERRDNPFANFDWEWE
mgnify:CR=1 FL=1